MHTYVVTYEHRHGTDLLMFKSDMSYSKLMDTYWGHNAELAKIIGIENFEPDRDETYSIYSTNTRNLRKLSAAAITAAIVKEKLTS